jgi:hypothetical protein
MYASTAVNIKSAGIPQAYVNQDLSVMALLVLKLRQIATWYTTKTIQFSS